MHNRSAALNNGNKFKGLTSRAKDIRPFYVMDLLARAKQLESQGRSIIHLEVGEPDFATAEPIVEAGVRALREFHTHYTAASGLPELRQAIADYYQHKFDLKIDSRRIIITPGASGALQLALSVLTDPGDQVLLSDPGYPCNRNIAQVLGVKSVNVPVSAETRYQFSAAHISDNWQLNTRAAMVANPSNPTGTRLGTEQMKNLLDAVDERGGHLIVDEIYQGLSYEVDDYTALHLSDRVFVINSFSKYFGMTGWRLGWMVVPDDYIDAVDKIAQNLFLAAPTISQYAALAAFQPETENILQQRVATFRQRRDYLVPALTRAGFTIPVKPEGAFYIYADCASITTDSFTWSRNLLEAEGVAVTPGIDFGDFEANTHVRFAYTRSMAELEEAVRRITKYNKLPGK